MFQIQYFFIKPLEMVKKQNIFFKEIKYVASHKDKKQSVLETRFPSPVCSLPRDGKSRGEREPRTRGQGVPLEYPVKMVAPATYLLNQAQKGGHIPAGKSRHCGGLTQSDRDKYSPYIQRSSYENASTPHTLTTIKATTSGSVSVGDTNMKNL